MEQIAREREVVIEITARIPSSVHIEAMDRVKFLATWLSGMLMWAFVPVAGNAPPSSSPASELAGELRLLIISGHLEGLRWPDFRDVQPGVSAAYAAGGYSPLWIENGLLTMKGQSVLAALRLSAAKGLRPEDYDAVTLARWAGDGRGTGAAAHDLARLDLALTLNLMRYASALHQGRVDPHRVRFAIRQKDRLDAAAFVHEFVASNKDLPELLAQLEPPFRGYRSTLEALARVQQLAAKEPLKMPVRPSLPLQRGRSYSDVSGLAERLAYLGDLNPSSRNGPPPRTYDGPVWEAVKRFQSRHGLPASGILDAPTWRALTTPLSRRVEQLQLTLERWRWLPSVVRPAIVVNIPEFQLRAFDDNGQLALRMQVIVGKAYRHRTPVFEDNLEAVIIRPWWNVPLRIQRNEMVPELSANPNYLSENRLQVVDQNNQPVPLPTQQELLKNLQSGDLRLRQEPGPANSLGLLKFDFPNNYSVYMHGTPARQLFSQARRDFSHGCIRVEDPEALAEWVLRRDPSWNRSKIAASCNGERTIKIAVSPAITVLVLYGTAVVEENGEVHFFDDVYGYDAELKKALASGYPYPSPAGP